MYAAWYKPETGKAIVVPANDKNALSDAKFIGIVETQPLKCLGQDFPSQQEALSALSRVERITNIQFYP